MPRQFYTLEERFRIRTRTIAARKYGMKWKQAHEIAKEAGFRGGIPALMIFLKKAKPFNPGRNKPTPVKIKRQPEKSEIEAVVDRIVKNRVNAALGKAIEVLRYLSKSHEISQ